MDARPISASLSETQLINRSPMVKDLRWTQMMISAIPKS